MANYSDLLDNEVVIDVLYAVMVGSNAPKDIEKRLNQNGKTVRSKLAFLRQSGIVVKTKWNYEADTNVIYNFMIRALSDTLKQYEKIAKNINKSNNDIKKIRENPYNYFPKDVVVSLVVLYAKSYFYGYDVASFKDISKAFLIKLSGGGSAKLIKQYPVLNDVKEAIKEIPATPF